MVKAGCFPEDRGCLVGCGSGKWSDDGVLSPVLTTIAARLDRAVYFVAL